MKIGIDLRSIEAGSQNRGIGRYITSLLSALSHIDTENEYVLFTSKSGAKLPEIILHDKFKLSTAHGKKARLRSIKYVRIIFIGPKPLVIDSYGLDVFFHVDTSQPIKARRTPVVSVLYDLIPYLFRKYYQHVHLGGYSPGHLVGYTRIKLRWKQLERSVQEYKHAAKIISISEHSKQDLIKFIPGIDPKKITAIPLAAGVLPKIDAAANKKMSALKLGSFLFYVGGADPRKGLVDFARSIEELWKTYPETRVLFAGKELTDPDVPEAVKLRKIVKKLSRPNQIHLLGFISDSELAWLYGHAAAFVFPSRYEGFGLPVLEAMQAGCPVVAYNNSSIPEVAGQAALLVKDGASIVPAIRRVLEDAKLRQKLISQGQKQAALFTWDKTARSTLKVLLAAAEGRQS